VPRKTDDPEAVSPDWVQTAHSSVGWNFLRERLNEAAALRAKLYVMPESLYRSAQAHALPRVMPLADSRFAYNT